MPPVVTLTPYQISNFEKLAGYLEDLELDNYHMGITFFVEDLMDPDLLADDVIEPGINYQDPVGLGAYACGVGCGPAAGISNEGYETWQEYAIAEFGMNYKSHDLRWCFSPKWNMWDNTALGTAWRIRAMLDSHKIYLRYLKQRPRGMDQAMVNAREKYRPLITETA